MVEVTDATYQFDWSDLAFGSKSPVNSLKATFIAAPRKISAEYFKELVKTHLPHGNILLGLAKEAYVSGFEDQPQFQTLAREDIEPIISQINKQPWATKIYTLHYFQRELPYILDKIKAQRVLFINGSWKYAFHTTEPFYVLHKRQLNYSLIPAFKDETEARMYDLWFTSKVLSKIEFKSTRYDELALMGQVSRAAALSFDYNFQTGAILARKGQAKHKPYTLITYAFNKVVPYQTHAMLYGALREKFFSPPHDLNHYDTIHAEVALILKAQQQKIDLRRTSLFINLMPCPPCARMLAESDIQEVVYQADHSEGYALRLFEEAGKKVRRLE